MSDRSIKPPAEKYENRMKAIAGLIKRLTYQEMNALSTLLQKYEDVAEGDGYPEALLAIADDILGNPDEEVVG